MNLKGLVAIHPRKVVPPLSRVREIRQYGSRIAPNYTTFAQSLNDRASLRNPAIPRQAHVLVHYLRYSLPSIESVESTRLCSARQVWSHSAGV